MSFDPIKVYSLAGDVLHKPLSEVVFVAQPELASQVKEEAYREQVLKAFIRRGRPIQIPAQRKKRQIVLEKLAEESEPGREYAECEVSRILVEFHDDVAALRRGLIEHGLMERTEGVYRRPVCTPDK